MSDNQPIKDPDNYSVAIPKNYYKLRVIEANEGQSQTSGNRMIKGKAEIIPKKEGVPTMISGQCIDGVQFFFNVVITPKAVKFVNECLSALGVPQVTEDSVNSVSSADLIGQEGFAMLHCKKEPEMDDDKNQLTDPYTGEPVFKYKREFLGWVPRPSK